MANLSEIDQLCIGLMRVNQTLEGLSERITKLEVYYYESKMKEYEEKKRMELKVRSGKKIDKGDK